MVWKYTLDNPMLGILVVEEPIGWPDAQITLRRDETMHGVVPEFSLQSYGFCCDGHDFILAVYRGQGIEGRVGLRVEVDCGDTGVYEDFFLGILNLSTVQFQRGENVAFANVEQDNPLQLVLNRIDVPVDLTKGTSVGGISLPTYSKYPIKVDISTGKTIRKRIVFNKDTTNGLICLNGHSTTFDCNDRGSHVWFSLGFPEIINDFGTDTLQLVQRGTYTDGDCVVTAWPPSLVSPPPLPFPFDLSMYFNAPAGVPALFVAPEDGQYCISSCVLDWTLGSATFTNGNICDCGTDPSQWCLAQAFFSWKVNGASVLPYFLENHDVTSGEGSMFSLSDSTDIGICLDLKAGDAVDLRFEVFLDGKYSHPIGVDECVALGATLSVNMPCCLTVSLDSHKALAGAKIQAFPPAELFDRVVRSISDNGIGAFTDYFGRPDAEPLPSAAEGCGARQALTSGFLIRQFPIYTNGVPPTLGDCVDSSQLVYNPGVFVSLKDLFDGYDAINNLGMGIERLRDRTLAIRVEAKEHFYRDNVVLELFDIDRVATNFQRQALPDHYWNEAAVGYADWQRDTVNGLDEYNTTRQYVTPLKTIRNKFERTCRFIASGYTFETMRRLSFFVSPTTGSARNAQGSSYDDNLFVLCLDEILAVSAIERGGGGITNMLFPAEAYNWRISPYYNMRRWLNWIGQSGLPNLLSTAFWRFSKGEGNYKASGSENVSGLGCEFGAHAENDSMASADGRGLPFVKPERLVFDYPLSTSQFSALEADPYGLVRLHYEDGTREDAYLWQVGYKPSSSIASLQLTPKNA